MPQVPDDADRPDHTIDLPDASASKAGMFDGASGATDANLEKSGDQVGPYKLISQLGEGGFGTVWLAERRQPFVQQVALKVIKAGMDSKAVIGRFEQERQALAVMNHPHVAKVLDGGLTAQGRPYFAMEFVKGEPITDFCDKHKLSIKDRLRLFLQVCEAIQHAHTKGIIHRDLKPGNVLVGLGEGDQPNAKVIDFGVAKALTQRMTEKTVFTETGQMIGTPLYMSPEQADPSDQDIDTRSDVYSLGVILYELLAGTTPFDIADLRSRAYREVQRMIREQDPPSPSARLSTIATKDAALATRIAQARKDAAASLARTLKSELEWIPLKAMRKERKERYDSPADLARDLQNYLEGKPLVAAPESTAYRVRKYIRRNRGFVVATITIVSALVVGLGSTLWQYRMAVRAGDAARASEARAVTEKKAAETARQQAVTSQRRAQTLLQTVCTSSALDSARRGDIASARNDLKTLEQSGGKPSFATRLASALTDQSLRASMLPAGAGPIGVISADPSGKFVAVFRWPTEGNPGHKIQLLDTTRFETVREFDHDARTAMSHLMFAPDGRSLVGFDSLSQTAHVWSVETGKSLFGPIKTFKAFRYPVLGFDDGGTTISIVESDGRLHTYDPVTQKPVGEPRRPADPMHAVPLAMSPDCTTFVSEPKGSDRLQVFEVRSGEAFGAPLNTHSLVLESAWLSPRSQFVLTSSPGSTLHVWDVATGAQVGGPISGWNCFAFDPDGTKVALGMNNGAIRILDLKSASRLGDPLHGHEGAVTSLTYSGDGHMLLSAGIDRTIRMWDPNGAGDWIPFGSLRERGAERTVAASDDFLAMNPAGTFVADLAFLPDGSELLALTAQGDILRYDPVSGCRLSDTIATGIPMADDEADPMDITRRIAVSAVGNRCAVTSQGGFVQVWDVGRRAAVAPPVKLDTDSVSEVRFADDGRTMLAACLNGSVHQIDVASGRSVAEFITKSTGNPLFAIRPRTREFAASGANGTVQRWSLDTGRPIGNPMQLPTDQIMALAISPDGNLLAAAGAEHSIHLIDLDSGSPVAEPMTGHTSNILSLVFTPDGSTLVSAGADKTMRFWDPASSRPLGGPTQFESMGLPRLAPRADGTDIAVLVSRVSSSRENVGSSASFGARLVSATPLRDRTAARDERMRAVAAAREILQSAARQDGSLEHLQAMIQTDPRLSGSMQIPARIALAELEDAQARVRSERLDELVNALQLQDWVRAARCVDGASPDLIDSVPPGTLNEIAWSLLTKLPPEAIRQHSHLARSIAEQAVRRSSRRDGALLDTLARAHWQLEDKGKAIEVQREAVERSRERLTEGPTPSETLMHRSIEATLKLYESLPAGSALPSEEPAVDRSAPSPQIAPAAP